MQLFQQLEEWAKEQQIHRLELTVVVENVIAIHLYKKIGFQIEGTKKHSLRINGQYVDEYIMSKLLDVE
ncbi:GNAT family N-acetyltransferase [Priestia flexa]|uniref:GNAT family N-acetyltransferase n=1 Tax=Priestia flexa TaxID=86664 RepID=UPI002815CB68|nr:GNAT family N-acetyltransferase [Priestia flexa]